MPNCSMSSGEVVGTISTAIWLPFFASSAASLASMRETAPPDKVPVRSVTRAVSGGTATCAPAFAKPSSRNRPVARRAARTVQEPALVRGRSGGRGCRREVHRRRLGNRRLILHGEIGLGFVAKHHRRQVDREG